MGESAAGLAPKGASVSQFGLVFYRHFTATRFSRQTGSDLDEPTSKRYGDNLFSVGATLSRTKWIER